MYVGQNNVIVNDPKIRNGTMTGGYPDWDAIMKDVRSNSSTVKTVPQDTCSYRGITFKVPLKITETLVWADPMNLQEDDMLMLKSIYPQDFNVVMESWKKAWLDRQAEKEFWGE